MKKLLLTVFSIIICAQLAGCSGWAVRTSSMRKPRVDQEVSGNRGFVSGKAASAPKEPAFTDRKVYRFEIETPALPQIKLRPIKRKTPTEDTAVWGNKGYIFNAAAKEIVAPEEPRQEEKTPLGKIKQKVSEILERAPQESAAQMRTYKARKGDTLQKISRRFYGTTKKWPLLYKANRDKLKSPDKVYPGQVLVIPEVAEYKK